MKIESVEMGWGEESTFYSTAARTTSVYRVDEIVCVERFAGKGLHNDLTYLVYEISKGGNCFAEIVHGPGVHVRYSPELPTVQQESEGK